MAEHETSRELDDMRNRLDELSQTGSSTAKTVEKLTLESQIKAKERILSDSTSFKRFKEDTAKTISENNEGLIEDWKKINESFYTKAEKNSEKLSNRQIDSIVNACKKEPSACKNEVNKLFPEKWFASGNYRKQRDRAIKIAEGMQQSAMEVDKDIQNIIKSNNMRSLLDDSRVRKGRDEANALANKKRDEMNELVVKLRENRELLAEARSRSQTGRPRMRKKIHDHVEFKLRPQDVLVSKKEPWISLGGY